MKHVSISLLILILVSCNMTPDLKKEDVAINTPDKFLQLNQFTSTDSVAPGKWWLAFNDPKLNEVIEKTMANNLDIKLAASRVKQFEAIFDINSAQQYPQINLDGSYAKQDGVIVAPFARAITGSDVIDINSENFSLKAGLRFNLDIWGKFRNLSNAAGADYMAFRYDLQTAYEGIIAQVAALYFQVKAQKQLVSFFTRIRDTYRNNLQIQRDKYAGGIGNKLAVDLTSQQYHNAEQLLAIQENLLIQVTNQLSVLLGEYPNPDLFADVDEIAIQLSTDKIPVAVPSQLLKQRNDIQSATYRIDAARHRIGVARADFFPNLSIGGTIGLVNSNLGDLFDPDVSLDKTLSVGVSQTIFDAGSKSAVLDQRWAEYEQSVLNYRKV
ncbi:MAG: efflux transporter outer membrane subunit, partial [Calditrichaeota bacterium]|nr:efflux transporter outer membrane subunit [Calditrichota bacterium]